MDFDPEKYCKYCGLQKATLKDYHEARGATMWVFLETICYANPYHTPGNEWCREQQKTLVYRLLQAQQSRDNYSKEVGNLELAMQRSTEFLKEANRRLDEQTKMLTEIHTALARKLGGL